jgi:hypothetical protein
MRRNGDIRPRLVTDSVCFTDSLSWRETICENDDARSRGFTLSEAVTIGTICGLETRTPLSLSLSHPRLRTRGIDKGARGAKYNKIFLSEETFVKFSFGRFFYAIFTKTIHK